MQIEAGKFYRDGEGKKRGPMVGDYCKWEDGRGGAADPEWENNGIDIIGDVDLIAEWVEPTAERKPKVGDRVRVLAGAFGTAGHFVGKTVEIVDVEKRLSGNGFILRFGDRWPLIDGEWEFAPDAAPNFKAGDRVVNVDDECPCRDITIGREYVLIEVDEDHIYFRDDAGDERTRLAKNYRAAAAAPPTANPDATSVPGDIVKVVASRYEAVPVGSLGRVTAQCKEGCNVRMCDDGLSYVFALDEIAKTDKQPEYEYEAGDAMPDGWDEFDDDACEFDADVFSYETDLRDDIAAETLALIIENEGADIVRARDHAATAYAYADAMMTARAA